MHVLCAIQVATIIIIIITVHVSNNNRLQKTNEDEKYEDKPLG